MGNGGLSALAQSLLDGKTLEVPTELGWADGVLLADNGVDLNVASVFALEDLVGDNAIEIVIDAERGSGPLLIETDLAPAVQGTVDAHVTPSGDDVAGYDFVAFPSGTTLFYPPGFELVITQARIVVENAA